MRRTRLDAMKKESRNRCSKKSETCVRVCSLFPAENVRSGHRMALSASPRPKSFWYPRQGVAKPFLFLFFTRSRINPICRVFRVNDAARGNVSLYPKIDIYAHIAAPILDIPRIRHSSRGIELLLFFFCHVCFRFHLREFVEICRPAGTSRKLHGIYVDNILRE